MTKIAIVDNHELFCDGLATYFKFVLKGYEVSLIAHSGEHFFEQLAKCSHLPEIVLMDIEMKPMNGIEATLKLTREYPEIFSVAMTALDDRDTMEQMIAVGARGYCLKNFGTQELRITLDTIKENGFYFPEVVLSRLKNNPLEDTFSKAETLSEREKTFFRLACSEDGYKQIADKMGVSEATVAEYRNHVYKKLNVKTRQGLLIYAFVHGMNKFS